jgi:hypothetical protein
LARRYFFAMPFQSSGFRENQLRIDGVQFLQPALPGLLAQEENNDDLHDEQTDH